ncbi:MAG: 16S rRNA (cytosine(967)-C(5))-methyltransferase RsmB, partial [Fusobacteriaceae bacterium]|nr:16S rRNA (cytosine(967)-C(5))-methyltransferase RsmB [Fusobacteriaceae bacterium]
MSVKSKIINLIELVDKGKYSNIILNQTFKEVSFLQKEKAFITEVFYGVLRNKMFLDYVINRKVKSIKKDWIKNLLRISIYQITYMESDNKGVVWEAAELSKKKFGVTIGNFVNGVLRSYIRDMNTIIDELKVSNEALYLSYPQWFYDRIKSKYGENYLDILKYLKKKPHLSIRVNKLKYNEEELNKFLLKNDIKILKKVDSVYYVENGNVIHTDEFKEGKIVIQDASSYLAAKNLGLVKGDTVLDTCSAPGGKLLVMAEIMENTGEITALDIYPHKIKIIEENCRISGVNNVKVAKLDARKINMQGKKFNKILVDVPCSGYGVISKKPESLYTKKPENIEELSLLQYSILEAASDVLADNGEMIYSTCTILE